MLTITRVGAGQALGVDVAQPRIQASRVQPGRAKTCEATRRAVRDGQVRDADARARGAAPSSRPSSAVRSQ